MRCAVVLVACIALTGLCLAKPVAQRSIPLDTPLRDIPLFYGTDAVAEFLLPTTSLPRPSVDVLGDASGILPTKCDLCKVFVQLANDYIMGNKTLGELESVANDVCVVVLKDATSWDPKLVCPGLMRAYAPPVVFILLQLALSPDDVCGRLGFCTAQSAATTVPVEDSEATLLVTGKKAPAPAPEVRASLPKDGKVFRVLQLSDMHVDAKYQEGSNAQCGRLTCCRAEYGTGTAGYWGDYNCDLPLRTISHALDFIKAMEPRPDLVVWTGDNPPHDLNEENDETQIVASSVVATLIRDHLADFAVAPCLGNHEGFPANLYYQPTYAWLTDGLAELWSAWLPEDALNSFRNAGYYTMLVRPGLRVVALNTQYGYQENFYFVLNSDVPAVEVYANWLNATLAAARAAGERVLLLGHVPPGQPDAIESYGKMHREIIMEYSSIIALQAFGHTHLDQFEVVRAKTGNVTGDPAGVAFIAPSMTTYTHLNPSFRVYEFDDATMELLDFKQYFMNLTKANDVAAHELASGVSAPDMTPPSFELEYSARDAYGLASMAPSEWLRMSDRMATDNDLLALYYKHRSTSARNGTCDFVCRRTIVCMTRSASVDEFALCMGGKSEDEKLARRQDGVDVYHERYC